VSTTAIDDLFALAEAVPKLNDPAWVYVALGSDEPLYVGKARSLRERLSNHSASSTWVDAACYVVAFLYAREPLAADAEAALIQLWRPPYNSLVPLREGERTEPLAAQWYRVREDRSIVPTHRT
jgi:excinuclease UvrABC nuclease subunit